MPSVAKFTFNWKIEWCQFDQLSTSNISKWFITSYKNVPFYWAADFSSSKKGTDVNKISFHVYYIDGPLDNLKDVSYSVEIMQPDKTVTHKFDLAKTELARGYGLGYANFADRNSKSLQDHYKLEKSEPFFCRVVMKIPMEVFSYKMQNPLENVESTPWLRSLFDQIDDPEKAIHANAKLISQKGKIFYCDKVIIGHQSSEFAAMFRHPAAENQNENEYDFPKLSTAALRELIEFLYTGKATMNNLQTSDVVELADAAEQYNFEKLKKSCGAWLWKRVVETPKSAFETVLFGHLHRDMKYLKQRAMDVLVENFEKFSLQDANYLATKFGNDSDLVAEFNLFVYRRLEADFCRQE